MGHDVKLPENVIDMGLFRIHNIELFYQIGEK
jgi:hypothetical protein